MEMALSDRVTGARSASRCFYIHPHIPVHWCLTRGLAKEIWQRRRCVVRRFTDCTPHSHSTVHASLQVFQGLAHSKLIDSLTRITRHTQSAVPSLVSLHIPARSGERALVKEEGMACTTYGCCAVLCCSDLLGLDSQLKALCSGQGRSFSITSQSSLSRMTRWVGGGEPSLAE